MKTPVVALVVLAVAFGTPAAANKESGSAIRSAGEIDYPPFCIVDAQGRADGFSVELLRETLAAMGRDVTFRTGAWNEVKGWLERGEVDALPLVGRTPEREANFDFTFPYMTLFGAIVVRDDGGGIRDLADLRGRRVAVMKADNAEEFLRRQDHGIDLHTTATFDEALRELSEGRHDAVVIQRLVALRLLAQMELPNLRVLPRPLETFRQDFCFAVRKGDAATLALLNEGLALTIADGTFRRLHAKWFAALELPSDRRLIVGGDHRYPPFESLNEAGQPVGFAVDLTRALAREMDLDVEIRLGPWAGALRALEEGEIDILQGIFYSEERSRRFDFTLPYTFLHYVSLVRAGEGRPPENWDDLAGRTLAVQEGDMMHDRLRELGLADALVLVESQEDILREVADGRADCGLVMRLSAARLMDRIKEADLALGRRPVLSAGYCMAVAKGNQALLTQLNEGLRLLKETGAYRLIHDHWLGVYDPPPPAWRTILRVAAIAGLPLLLIALLALAWSWSLRRQVTRRTAEARASETRFRTFMNNAPVYAYIKDDALTHVYGNQRVDEMAEAAGLDAGKVSSGTLFDPAAAGLVEAADRRILSGETERVELEYLAESGGKRRWFHDIKFLLKWPDGRKAVGGLAVDITDRVELEEKVRQAQKMELIGRLAGGVAHDFNNVLMGIMGSAEMARDLQEAAHPVRAVLDDILTLSGRAADLTRQLLAFARKQTIEPKVLDLNDAVAGALKMIRRLIGKHIELAWMPGGKTETVKMDPGQIEQMLTNLCINARDAIESSGTISIGTDRVQVDEAYCRVHGDALPGRYAVLWVSDDGHGMTGEEIEHAFEPFFTTKPVGQGTGLGLATVYGIVKQNNGFVNVYSEPGEGSTFRIYLPLFREENAPDEAAEEADQTEPEGGSETLLLAEDEKSVRVILDRTTG